MRTGRPTAELVTTDDELAALRRWARRPKSAQALALRSKIVLACAEGKSNAEVAAALQITKQTVGKWRARFVEKRLEGLVDEPRPGTPRKISDEHVERRTYADAGIHAPGRNKLEHAVFRCSVRPEPQHRRKDMARVCASAAPQRNLKLSKDPLFVEKVRDVAGIYLNPPERALVLCLDEKS